VSSESNSFALLDERIQRYIWGEKWTELREAQEQAIPLILPAQLDVIIAAATAAGKTEAAFLPALTRLLQTNASGGLIVYISPLKALINDQFGRLDRLCENLEVTVWPWHGDISSAQKSRFLANPRGVLLITPESVEATLCRRGTAIAKLFSKGMYFIVDELHSFIGTERGKQLQSQLHRLELAAGRRIPRIGLSATLGDMSLAAEFLRPGQGGKVALVNSGQSDARLEVLVKGYDQPLLDSDTASPEESEKKADNGDIAIRQVAADLFRSLRGTNNLVFPNSRREVERFTYLLSTMCTESNVPNEFWPHHGNLSRQIRSRTEAALKQKVQPATAICTNTLELGIDIGAVKSVAQIASPPSVASLRQRLGRSGRRKGEAAVLRGYCIEEVIGPDPNLFSQLRLNTVQFAAMTLLLLEGWCEPPAAHGLHLSTLIQQVLSLIAEKGGVSAGDAFAILCSPGAPFTGVSSDDFKLLLQEMGRRELLMQDSSGLLLCGVKGEKLVDHYTFYAAFASDEEYRIIAGGDNLGTLPISQLLRPGQHLVFAGKTWVVEEVRDDEKAILVAPTKGGAPPLFSGGAGRTHTKVRQKMRALLSGSESISFLDAVAQRHLEEGRVAYHRLGLANRKVVDLGSQTLLLTWMGDSVNEALACYLSTIGLKAWTAGPGVEIHGDRVDSNTIEEALKRFAPGPPMPISTLLADAENLEREKWDWALPVALLQRNYEGQYLDLDGAVRWIKETFDSSVVR
jgi:ATP-dependent Lhr-like helicase